MKKDKAWLREQIRAANPDKSTGPELPLDKEEFIRCSKAVQHFGHGTGQRLNLPSALLPPLP